jgi:CRISPR-associated exonuclease Cas4
MLPLSLLLFLFSLLLWLLARRARRATGLPAGRVVYSDTGGWARPERALFSKALLLTGKPDYLVEERGAYVPVEVKSGRAPAGGPHPGHVYQLAAYCALAAEAYSQRPAYGLIRYADQTLRVDYTPALEAELRRLLDAMRADDGAEDVPRSHDSPARCRACGFRDQCEQALIEPALPST